MAPKRLLSAVAYVGAVGLIGWADYLLGPDVQLSVVYLVPIVASAFWAGRLAAVVTALAAGLAWFINAELVGPRVYGPEVVAWNGFSRLAIYLLLAILVDRIRHDQVELHRLDRLREDFLAMVAHELRQPAAALSLVATGLSTSDRIGSAEQRLLSELQRLAQVLSRLAAQLLAIGHLESGDLSLNRIRIDLREIAADAARDAPAPNRVELSLPAGAVTVEADPERIRQAVDNLIGNALKYSPAAEPVLVHVEEEDGHARVDVRDRGIGLAADEIPRLFRKYGRIDRSETARVAGVGLGLYLTRMLVEAHGGTVAASSAGRGAGATFSFTLPIAGRDGAAGHER